MGTSYYSSILPQKLDSVWFVTGKQIRIYRVFLALIRYYLQYKKAEAHLTVHLIPKQLCCSFILNVNLNSNFLRICLPMFSLHCLFLFLAI